MEVFGPEWADYASKIERNWKAVVEPTDLVLVPGDISWAMSTDQARIDLEWIGNLPGTKVMIKGNHDYWWSSLSKVQQILPPSIHIIQNNAFNYEGFSIGGARLWDSDEYNFNSIIQFKENPLEKEKKEVFDQEKIFQRELERLELSLKMVQQEARLRIVMTHYPPIGVDLKPSQVSALLEKYHIDICVFGHLHNVIPGPHFGTARGVTYHLTSADYLAFRPLEVPLVKR
jgi:predicted phosphohydrolase